MTPLYSQFEFDNAKSRQLLPLRCKQCLQIFHRTKHWIMTATSENHHSTADFCSRKCCNIHYHPAVTIECEQCHKIFRKNPAQIKKTKHHFCNSSCAALYHNTHKVSGIRVSKLEIWLQSQLPILYPNLEFHFNRKDAINGELDIYIPSLKLAFELNGIFHYEPIYGPEKLSQIQNNDCRKNQACLEKQIELCLIDVSSFEYFKPSKAKKYLDIISDIINLKLSKS